MNRFDEQTEYLMSLALRLRMQRRLATNLVEERGYKYMGREMHRKARNAIIQRGSALCEEKARHMTAELCRRYLVVDSAYRVQGFLRKNRADGK